MYSIAGSADILQFSFSGHARVSDAAGHDYLIQGQTVTCHRSEGCQCPSGSDQVPPLPLEGSGIDLAMSGDPGGDSGTVTGISLDQFCSINVTGRWTGSWSVAGHGGSVTLRLVQTGQKVSGTITLQSYPCKGGGASEFLTLQATGTVTGTAITLKATIGQVTFNGTVKGTTMSGTAGPPYCGFSVASWQMTKSK